MAKKVIEANGKLEVRVFVKLTKDEFARVKEDAKFSGKSGGVSEHLRRVLREYIKSFTGGSDEA